MIKVYYFYKIYIERRKDNLAFSQVSVGGAGLIRCIDSSGDGHLVAVAHSSGVISVLDIRTGHLLSTWKPHEGEVLRILVIFNYCIISLIIYIQYLA